MPDACVGCCRSCREQVKHDLEHRLWEAGAHAKYKSAETKREIVLKMQNAQDAALTQGDASGAAALGAVAKGPLGSVGIMAPPPAAPPPPAMSMSAAAARPMSVSAAAPGIVSVQKPTSAPKASAKKASAKKAAAAPSPLAASPSPPSSVSPPNSEGPKSQRYLCA